MDLIPVFRSLNWQRRFEDEEMIKQFPSQVRRAGLSIRYRLTRADFQIQDKHGSLKNEDDGMIIK